MSAKHGVEKKKESFANTMSREVVHQLTQAFPELKEMLGEKKFGKRIKKAAKLLSEGAKPSGSKKAILSKPVTATAAEKKKSTASPVKKPSKPATTKK